MAFIPASVRRSSTSFAVVAGSRQPATMFHDIGFTTAALTLDVDQFAASVIFLTIFGLPLVKNHWNFEQLSISILRQQEISETLVTLSLFNLRCRTTGAVGRRWRLMTSGTVNESAFYSVKCRPGRTSEQHHQSSSFTWTLCHYPFAL